MRKFPAAAFGGVAALMIAGASFAATPKTHVMNVALPGGSVARVEYVGDVAPKVTITPAPMTAAGAPAGPDAWAMPMMPSFADFDRMIADMSRRSQEMVRQAREMARQPAGAAPYVASFGNLPAGQSSTTIVSVSDGGKSCTRTTQVVSQGAGKAPKVTSSATGDCDSQPAAAGAPVDRT